MTEMIRQTPANLPATVVASIEELVGNTPMMRIPSSDPTEHATVLAKLEMFNPLSNVKDRPALHMLREAEFAGEIGPGGTVIEVSSGSTGISLAALSAARGYRCIIVMPDNATEERKQILRAFGAEVVLFPAENGLLPAWEFAEKLQSDTPGSWLAHQDQNPGNVFSHYTTTGPEIWEVCGGQVDVFVCGVGTGGTLTGVARYLREHREVYVVAVEPARSAVLSGGEAGPHGIPGIGAGYVSDIMEVDLIDEVIAVADDHAFDTAQEITRTTGLMVGVSSGAAAYASRVIAGREEWAEATIVTVFPDTGERYLSM